MAFLVANIYPNSYKVYTNKHTEKPSHLGYTTTVMLFRPQKQFQQQEND